MGQANKRGTREERVAAAIERDKREADRQRELKRIREEDAARARYEARMIRNAAADELETTVTGRRVPKHRLHSQLMMAAAMSMALGGMVMVQGDDKIDEDDFYE